MAGGTSVVNLDWMLLANYAEAAPGGGTVHMINGGWDTMNVRAPFEPPPGSSTAVENAVTVLQGNLVVRILFHQTELARDRTLRLIIIDEDGQEVGKIEGGFRAEPQPGHPASWEQGVNLVFPLQGLPMPKFGLYRISALVDEQHLGDREFRVLKLY